MIGSVIEQTWTTIAADSDGVVLTEEIGKRRTTRHAAFAFRSEAEGWIASEVAAGWEHDSGPTPYATFYHGPTDSPSNCWSAHVSKEVRDAA